MLVSYPALFYYDKDTNGYFVTFPDIENSATQGDDINDALFMASDYLGISLAHELENGGIIPKFSNINETDLISNFPFKEDEELKEYYLSEESLKLSFKSMVGVNITNYLDSKKLIKKTVNIANWVNDLGVRKK